VKEPDFAALVEPHRGALLAHCYRMLGTLADAEDAVQDTLLRAWRSVDRFEGRSRPATWLHAIATNVCLRALEKRPQLALVHGPPAELGEAPGEPLLESVWVGPFPDAGAAYERRESIELSFVAALQYLAPQQRAVLILREVLGFSAAETADALDTTVAAVNSALQRARRTIDERLPQRSEQTLDDDAIRAVVAEFADAWERADVPAVVKLLADDVVMTMPPMPTWYSGRETVAWFLADRPMSSPRWKAEIVSANGGPAVAIYLREEETFTAHSINVLAFDGGRITGIYAFIDAALFEPFGLPPTGGRSR
jgi:RNA polymerase sigma-70 factor (ECF subfamily)